MFNSEVKLQKVTPRRTETDGDREQRVAALLRAVQIAGGMNRLSAFSSIERTRLNGFIKPNKNRDRAVRPSLEDALAIEHATNHSVTVAEILPDSTSWMNSEIEAEIVFRS